MSSALKKSKAHIPQLEAVEKSSWEVLLGSFFYNCVVCFANIVVYIFFREVKVKGGFRVPKKGAAILVCAPHANQFVDGAIVMTQVKHLTNRNISSVIAESSYKQGFIGTLAKLSNSIPVPRAQDNLKPCEGTIYIEKENSTTIYGRGTQFTKLQVKGLLGLPQSAGNTTIEEIISDTELRISKPYKPGSKATTLLLEGTSFKFAEKISNDVTFQHVFNHLHSDGIIAIFPEGGSHDRPDLLPIKAGVAIMALGTAAADPNCKLQVIPTGLNYFHRNEFRSRSVLEFGDPIPITHEMGLEYKENPRGAVQKLLERISDELHNVTLTAPDYETLMVIQQVRRLYAGSVPLSLVIEMNRRLLVGYKHFKDDPRIIKLKNDVMDYNYKLDQLGLRDHQVEEAVRLNWFMSLVLLVQRIIMLSFYFLLSLPGTVLFAPIFIITDKYSKKKQKEALAKSVVKIKAVDVIASWKIIVATIAAPALYITYSVIGVFLTKQRYNDLNSVLLFIVIYLTLVMTTFSALKIGEIGMDIVKSLPPLFASLFGSQEELRKVKKIREKLTLDITEVVNTLAPAVFPNFNEYYKIEKKEEEGDDDETTGFVRRRKKRSDSEVSTTSSVSSVSSAGLSRVHSSGYFSDVSILGGGSVSDAESDVELEKENKNSTSIKLRNAMNDKIAKEKQELMIDKQ